MADEADIAFDFTDRAIAASVEEHRRTTNKMVPIGSCYYCGTHLETPRALFCKLDDLDCAKDWENEQRLVALRGNGSQTPAD